MAREYGEHVVKNRDATNTYYEKNMKAQDPNFVKRLKAPNTSRKVLKERLRQLVDVIELKLSITE